MRALLAGSVECTTFVAGMWGGSAEEGPGASGALMWIAYFANCREDFGKTMSSLSAPIGVPKMPRTSIATFFFDRCCIPRCDQSSRPRL